MFSRAVLLLAGGAFLVCQILAQDFFVAELTIESNMTLEGDAILGFLSTTTSLEVDDSSGVTQTVTILSSEISSECLIVGDDTNCNCSLGYIWSNDVCYNFSCCQDEPCTQNVSHITPLCVEKVPGRINGSIQNPPSPWDASQEMKLTTAIKRLNAMTALVITPSPNKVEFKAELSSELRTSVLDEIVNGLKADFPKLAVDAEISQVTIDAPQNMVCYMSDLAMTCKFTEASETSFWEMSQSNKLFLLNNGSVVKLKGNCGTGEYPSCTHVTLEKVTGIWEGLYKCRFARGTVYYTNKAFLNVALLPDELTMTSTPLTADCSSSETVDVQVTVTATAPNNMQTYQVLWRYKNTNHSTLQMTTDHKRLFYKFTVPIVCVKTTEAHLIEIFFKNSKNQVKSAQLEIPVIYPGDRFCKEDIDLNADFWPQTPYKATVVNKTCSGGRSGFKSRTCVGPEWQEVFYNCVKEELNDILNAADNFLKGQGATQEVAMNIFTGMKNNSKFSSDSGENTADVSASISVFSKMSEASESITFQNELFPTFVDSASNMLTTNWSGVNDTVRHTMSADYLQALESLVQNINSSSEEQKTENIDIVICPGSSCNVTLFNTEVSLNKSFRRPKIAAIRNLMPKLENTFRKSQKIDMLISATLQNDHLTAESNTSDMEIIINFLTEKYDGENKRYCVFWDIAKRKWSDEGCKFVANTKNRSRCVCNHLTSFSVLMAKRDISNGALDIITNVGLAVSVCSLVLLLVIEAVVWTALVKSNLSHFRHTAIVNIATFRLLADISFLASSSPEDLSDTMCFTFTMCKHLFYLAMFCWMLCLSIMLVHQLIFVFSPLRKRVFMFLSAIVGYIFPILIVGSSYVYCKYTFKEYYSKKTCWLVFDRILEGSIHSFLIPVGSVMLTNLFSIVVVIVTLTKATVANSGKSSEMETAKSIIKVLVLLAPVFGITWIIGFFLLILDEDDPMFPAANYSFTILNSFQGLFILFAGCFAEQKVRDEFIKVVTGKSKDSDSSRNLTSTMYTKDK